MPRRSTLLLLGLGLLALAVQLVAAHADSLAIHEREELYNAAHAWILRGEGLDLALPLQYQWFCGGCAVDAVVGAGWFGLMGPSVLAWRMVGWTWWALALVAGMFAARRVAGTAGAAAVAVAFALAPPAYQELGLICNGNHPEGGALLAVQLALAVFAVTSERPLWREAALVAQAVLVGFGLYFVRSLVLGVPLLLVTLVLARASWRAWLARVPLVLLGLRLGAAPLFAVRDIIGHWPLEPVYQADEWKLSLEWVPRNFLTLFHPLQIQGIWGDVSGSAGGLLGFAGLLGWAVLVGLLAWALVRWRSLPDDASRARWAAVLAGGVLACFLVLYLPYRLAVSMDGNAPPYPQQVRYLGVIAPVALIAAGVGFGRAWALPRARWVALAALVLFSLPGLTRRARTLDQATWGAARDRNAPDWCFQAERLRGSSEVLTRAGLHTPLPLLPYAAGTLAGDHRAVMDVATEPDADGLLARPLPGDARACEAWQRGRVTGVTMLARDEAAGMFAAWAGGMARGLASDPPPSDALLESAWCQGRELLVSRPDDAVRQAWSAGEPPWDEPIASQLLGVALGTQAPLACPDAAEPGAKVVLWDPSCESWLSGLPADAVGWGMGVIMAEYWGRELHGVTIRAPGGDTPALLRGFERGWAYGSALYWLPERAPLPRISVE